MEYQITLIPGDGIGPEIVTEATKVLDAIGQKYGHTFSYTKILMGGASIDATGEPLTKEALETIDYEVVDKINTHSAYSAGMFLETRETNQALDKLFAWIEKI